MLLAVRAHGRPFVGAQRLRTSLLVVLAAAHLLCLAHIRVCVAVIRRYHALHCLVAWALSAAIDLLVVHIFEPHELLLLRWRYVRAMLLVIRARCKIKFS